MTGDTDLPPHLATGPGDEQLTMEFAYTTWDDSCQDPYSPYYQCRRPRGHAGDHAAGFGAGRIIWKRETS